MIRTLFVVLALAPALARAVDMSVGAVELSGFSNLGLSFSSTKSDGRSSIDATDVQAVLIGLAYVTPQLGVGLAGGYDRSDIKFSGTNQTSWSFSIGPAAAVVFPVQEKLSFVLHGDVGILRSGSSGAGPFGGSGSGWAFDLGGDLRYFLARSFSVNGGVLYSYAKRHEDGGFGVANVDTTASALGLRLGLSVYFGN